MTNSKTPKFDELLDEILSNLVPNNRECLDCKNGFNINAEDIVFYKMFRVPPPTLCPHCRNRRRLSFANYSNIYKRKCDVPGHNEIMISPVSPVMPWITYDHETYYGDTWDAFSFGKDIDNSKTFTEQFFDLLKIIPQPGVRRGADSPNSDYSFYGKHMKDCYYVFGGRRSEDIMFSSAIYDSRHIMDSYFLREVDTGYDNVGTSECFKCMYAYFSSNCMDCKFIYDCRNCSDCFGCVNLRNQKYCYFNEQLSKEAYMEKMSEIDLGNRSVNKEFKEKFLEFVKSNPIRAVRIQASENVSGNDIKNSKNCHNVFQTEDSENVRYTYFTIMNLKNCMDANHGGHGDGFYDTQNVASSSNIKFSFAVKESANSEYLMSCVNCQDCFACVGLKNASYCIFNKQYEKEEYYEKLDAIKTKMLQDGTYGEFLPMSFSPVAYNSSFAHVVYPMTEEYAVSRGLFWHPEGDIDVSTLDAVSTNELPENVSEVTDEFYSKAIIGESSKKPFRLTKREVDFYKRYNIALPTDTPYTRMMDRFKLLNNFQVVEENCDSCAKITESAYKKGDGYKPYCDSCYKKSFV